MASRVEAEQVLDDVATYSSPFEQHADLIATVVGLAPFNAPDLDFFDGMDSEPRADWDVALGGHFGPRDEEEKELLAWLGNGRATGRSQSLQ